MGTVSIKRDLKRALHRALDRRKEEGDMAKPGDLKPGQTAPHAGDYDLVGQNGQTISGHDPATMDAGETMPPTPKSGQHWRPRR